MCRDEDAARRLQSALSSDKLPQAVRGALRELRHQESGVQVSFAEVESIQLMEGKPGHLSAWVHETVPEVE